MSEQKQFTLTDYNDLIKPTVDKMAERFAIDILWGTIELFPPGPPPTRKQRVRWWIEDKKQRAKDIWTILRGKDIHEDCRDY